MTRNAVRRAIIAPMADIYIHVAAGTERRISGQHTEALRELAYGTSQSMGGYQIKGTRASIYLDAGIKEQAYGLKGGHGFFWSIGIYVINRDTPVLTAKAIGPLRYSLVCTVFGRSKINIGGPVIAEIFGKCARGASRCL